MSDKRYVVTGHLAAFDTMTSDGLKRITFYRGQPVPQDATATAIAHNLSVNLIAEVPGGAAVGVDAAGAAVADDERVGITDSEPGEPFLTANTVTEGQAQDVSVLDTQRDSEVESKREKARAKLAEIGGTPDGRSSDEVMVEYLVGKGYNRADVEKADRAELKSLVSSAK